MKFAESAAPPRQVNCVERAGGLAINGRDRDHGHAREEASRSRGKAALAAWDVEDGGKSARGRLDRRTDEGQPIQREQIIGILREAEEGTRDDQCSPDDGAFINEVKGEKPTSMCAGASSWTSF